MVSAMMRNARIGMLGILLASLNMSDAVAKDCGDLFITRTRSAFGSHSAVVAEVLIKFEEYSKYQVAGILFNGDWGAMNVCAPEVSIRVRWLFDANSSVGTRKDDDRGEIKIKMSGRQKVYLSIARDYSELDERQGVERIRRIEEEGAAQGYPLAGWEFRSDRYGLICRKCDQFRPDDYMTEPLRK
jgi:hypothetical protein